MFKIYFNTAIRHLSRSSTYVIINIIGLATGITAMLLAILFWRDEEGYDRFHQNSPNLYRVVTTYHEFDNKSVTVAATGQVQGPAFEKAIPEIKNYSRVFGGEVWTNMIANNKTIKVQ